MGSPFEDLEYYKVLEVVPLSGFRLHSLGTGERTRTESSCVGRGGHPDSTPSVCL